jgi:hypothetical protein
MSDNGNVDGARNVINFVDDAVIADPDSPEVLVAFQFKGADRSGIDRQLEIFSRTRTAIWRGNFSNSFRAERANVME